jgi:RimJ/RimL family protein N-acetyltransferase
MTSATQQTTYPRMLTLRHEYTVQVRPMGVEDAGALHTFFCRIPEEDLLFLRRDVTNREVIESWALDVAAGQTFTLLAEARGQVVGEASVHRSRAPWSGHVGEIRVVVDAEHRRVGLGSALVQAIFLEALGRGIEKIVAEMTPDQTGAINVFQKLGVQPEGLFRAHVRDRAGTKRDLIVMAHEVAAAGGLLTSYGVAEALGG